MSEKLSATLTSKGQMTLSIELRRAWDLKPGDRALFDQLREGSSVVQPRRRRSIPESLGIGKLPDIGRPFAQGYIDESVGQAMIEKEARSRARS